MDGSSDGSAPGIRALTSAVGAQVTGVDLAHLDEATFAIIRKGWLHHAALLFRNQRLTDEQLVAFSRRFGDLDHAPVMENGRTAVPGLPEVYVVSNVLDGEGRPIGSLGAGEAVWHTDMSYLPIPPDASMLYALEVPAEGGDTWLYGMAAAWQSLPEGLRRQVQGRLIKHDGTYNSGGYLRAGVEASDDPRRSVGHPHPIVCRHPENDRELLYLGRRRNAYVVGLPLEESEALLDALWRHVEDNADKLTYAHSWRVGDLLLWDNRSTLHRRDSFDPASRRVMHRTQIKGRVAPRAAGAAR
jgi:taurine dioxygenase